MNGLGHEPDPIPQQVLQQQPPTHLQQQNPQLGQQAIVTPNVVTPVIQQAVSGLPIPQQPQQQHQQTPTGIIQQQPSPPQSQPQQHQQPAVESDKLDSVSPVSVTSGAESALMSDSETNDPKYGSSQNQEPKTFAHLLKSIGGNTPSPVPHNQHQQQPQLINVGSGSNPQNYPGQYNRGGDNGQQQQGMPQRSNSIRNKENNNKNGKRLCYLGSRYKR